MTTLSAEQLTETVPTLQLQAGALVLLAAHHLPRLKGRVAEAIEALLHRMAHQHAAALIASGRPDAHHAYPQPLRDLASKLSIPLMVTFAPPERWENVNEHIQSCRAASAEHRAAQLDLLMQQLPAHLADPKAMQRITDWLSQSLDAHVLVSEPERVLAAAPGTAAEHLARAIIRQSVEGGTADNVKPPHTQLVSLAPATGAETVLAVASRAPFEETETRLIRHAAKLLGLVDQARREYQTATAASVAARTATVELLVEGESIKAQRVLDELAPGLLDTDTARVLVIGVPAATRDVAMRRCETALAGRALVIADPGEAHRIVVIHPIRPGEETNDGVLAKLRGIMATLGPDASLGGSSPYSASLLAEAFQEAVTAQRFAVHQPGSTVLSAETTDFVSLLALREAQRWAAHLLHPVMTLPRPQWQQLRDTLPAAFSYPYTVAARRLGLHRNTITRRVAHAADLLSLDLGTVPHRIAVGLALEVVAQREPDVAPADDATSPPTLPSLLDTPEIRAWADTLLRSAQRDRRDLLTTAVTWLECDARIEPATRALGYRMSRSALTSVRWNVTSSATWVPSRESVTSTWHFTSPQAPRRSQQPTGQCTPPPEGQGSTRTRMPRTRRATSARRALENLTRPSRPENTHVCSHVRP
ncbi:helix-turn-helix domain-containing protein [Streptomyces sp. FXJ1.4098]|nr:helix-turn-helix domain-containing protein [Streptomyces sp. FXJ1.4098]